MRKDIYAVLAKQLRLKRLQAGLTIEDLADAAGISASFLAYLEAERKKPSLATVASISAALDVPVSELLNERTLPQGGGEEQKVLARLLRLLRGQSRENMEIILSAADVLAKKLSGKRT
ncbi:MAG: helix-turn-helix transcriptional regulator [Elusimicrobia bacterium]|nr:helix-turn-helix transcriptional regulator [Elusimicrobiota bacterium]